MQKIRVQLIYKEDLVKEPIICMVCKKFDIVLNIRKATVTKDTGVLVVEIDGEEEEIERVIDFLKEKGIDVQPLEGHIFRE